MKLKTKDDKIQINERVRELENTCKNSLLPDIKFLWSWQTRRTCRTATTSRKCCHHQFRWSCCVCGFHYVYTNYGFGECSNVFQLICMYWFRFETFDSSSMCCDYLTAAGMVFDWTLHQIHVMSVGLSNLTGENRWMLIWILFWAIEIHFYSSLMENNMKCFVFHFIYMMSVVWKQIPLQMHRNVN